MKIITDNLDEIKNLLKEASTKPQLINRLEMEVSDDFHNHYGEDDKWINLKWTQAIKPELVAKNEEDEKSKASWIIALFLNNDVKDKKICEFGTGHIAALCRSRGAQLAINDFDKMKNNAPYDYILMYDFLDHVEDPISYLILARECLDNTGKLIIRFHPWCSRHGGHIYDKAWIHMFVSDETLVKLGGKVCHQKVTHPINTYDSWIAEAKLVKKEKEVALTQPIEPLMKAPDKIEKIYDCYKNSPVEDIRMRKKFPEFQMSVTFVDYILAKK